MVRPPADDLRKLYLDDRLTTRQVATIYDVSHASVKRWLHLYGIPVRPKGNGLEYRGITPPTPDELNDMVHVQHLSYLDIAARYGVDDTTVPLWLKKHGIRRPTIWETRRKGHVPSRPTEEDLRSLRGERWSSSEIADRYDVDRTAITQMCRDLGIPVGKQGWTLPRRSSCPDAHPIASRLERLVDDWLREHGIAHVYGPRLPFDRSRSADFLVGDLYIEVWGVDHNDAYDERRRRKVALYRANGVQFISLDASAFSVKRGRPFADLLAAAFLEERAA